MLRRGSAKPPSAALAKQGGKRMAAVRTKPTLHQQLPKVFLTLDTYERGNTPNNSKPLESITANTKSTFRLNL
jgi:hypothetical protein